MVTAEPETGGRVISVETENFKSYKGLRVIGPFSHFTAVIGPNGSGKSNLMDAISFVCGVKTAHLRANLKELLYCNRMSGEQPGRGHVTLVFETKRGDVIRFKRSILKSTGTGNSSYSSRYEIDDKPVTFEGYMQRLLSVGINTRAQNFLVFQHKRMQGEVERVAQKTPKELTKTFELISGSVELEPEYNEMRDKMQEMELRMEAIHKKVKNVKNRKRMTKDAKDEAEHFQQKQLKEELEKLKAKQRDEQDRNIEQQIAALKKQRAQKKKEVDEQRRLRDEQNPKVIKLREVMLRKKKELSRVSEQLSKIQEDEKSRKSDLKARKKESKKLDQELNSVQNESQQVGGIEMTAELQQEYTELRRQADELTLDDTSNFKKEQELAETKSDRVAMLREQLQRMKAEKQRLEAQLTDVQVELKTAQADKQEKEQELKVQEQQEQKLQGEHRKISSKRTKLQQELDSVTEMAQRVQSDFEASKKEQRMAQAVRDMRQQFGSDEVFGRLPDVCKVMSKKYNTAMAVLVGRHMDSVVVSTLEVAKGCIELLREKKLAPMEFLPLDNIKVPNINESLRCLPGAKMGIDLLEYRKTIEKAVLHAIGNSLVTETVTKAREISRSNRIKVAAVDGTLLLVNGSMQGGSTRFWIPVPSC